MPHGSAEVDDLLLRAAVTEDAEVLAELFVGAREAAFPAMPRPVHEPGAIRGWFAELLGGDRETWVAERAGEVVGYLVLDPGWLDSIYVRRDLTGHGIGGVLLDLAKSLRPDGFGLWVFESNAGARRFYRRHGLVEIRRTDGSDNEEGAPDVEMAWLGRDPVAALRRRVDALDDQLAALLEQRATLTARIQEVKAVPGHAGRDPAREAQIADRMARVAPSLGTERVRRIMREVITASLDAARDRRGGPGVGPGG